MLVVAQDGGLGCGQLNAPAVVAQHNQARQRVEGLAADAGRLQDVKGTLPHPLLGAFRAAAWVRFADVHTRHHLRIVADIDRRRAIGVPDAAAEAAHGEDPGLGVSVESP